MIPLSHSLVAFESKKGARFEGTGIVVAPHAVLTCAHVLSNGDASLFETTFGADNVYSAGEIRASLNGVWYSPARICFQQVPKKTNACVYTGDYCCVHFDRLPGAIPVSLCRSRRLTGNRFRAAGFTPELRGARQSSIKGVQIIQHRCDDETGTVQEVQVEGGFPEGYSGGPVFADIESAESSALVVGMLQRGGTRSTRSRFLAVDAFAEFLLEQLPGISFGIFNSDPTDPATPMPPASSPPGVVGQRVKMRDVSGSVFNINQVAKGRE